jgi:hypothetical protein
MISSHADLVTSNTLPALEGGGAGPQTSEPTTPDFVVESSEGFWAVFVDAGIDLSPMQLEKRTRDPTLRDLFEGLDDVVHITY